MTENEHIDLEMAYSVQPHMNDTCGNIFGVLIECTRANNHSGDHAAGFGKERIRW